MIRPGRSDLEIGFNEKTSELPEHVKQIMRENSEASEEITKRSPC